MARAVLSPVHLAATSYDGNLRVTLETWSPIRSAPLLLEVPGLRASILIIRALAHLEASLYDTRSTVWRTPTLRKHPGPSVTDSAVPKATTLPTPGTAVAWMQAQLPYELVFRYARPQVDPILRTTVGTWQQLLAEAVPLPVVLSPVPRTLVNRRRYAVNLPPRPLTPAPPIPRRRCKVGVLLIEVPVTRASRPSPLALNRSTRVLNRVTPSPVLCLPLLSLDRLRPPLDMSASTVYLPSRVPSELLYLWYPHRASFRLRAILLE